MTTTTEKKTLQLAVVAALALGAQLEGGTFQGIVTLPNGTHAAIVLLADKPDKLLTWKDAKAWAKSVDGELPNRPAAVILFANAKDQFEPRWHWLGEDFDGSDAWVQGFDYGGQDWNYVTSKLCARAVRMIPLSL
ncbi:MAG: hypothetical protein PVS3B2_00570 [Candidatus Dormibacteraceae bacterium]